MVQVRAWAALAHLAMRGWQRTASLVRSRNTSARQLVMDNKQNALHANKIRYPNQSERVRLLDSMGKWLVG